jgi:RNA polymerase sigma factor (sigma-70 family)
MAPMNDDEFLLQRFEEHRAHLRAVAYRMLGSLSEADDALQESWLRLNRTDTSDVENLGGWLTTVTARVCLNMLRARSRRKVDDLESSPLETFASADAGADPETEAVLADSVGLAMLVVLETLSPAERLAFVLHDMFALPFDEIAPVVGRTPTAARQLASRARNRVQGRPAVAAVDLARQRDLVDAFLAAARMGDFDALIAVLDPDLIARRDVGGRIESTRGAEVFAGQALSFPQRARFAQMALINGSVGFVVAPRGRLVLAFVFTVGADRISEIDVITDRARLRALDIAVLDAPTPST